MIRSTLLTRAALIAALSLSAAQPARAQAALAGSPVAPPAQPAASALAAALVDAVNSTDDGAIPRFLDHTLSPEARQPRTEILDILRAFRDEGGGVTVGASRVTSRGNLVVELWARRLAAGLELTVFPDPADSTRLMRLRVEKPLRPGASFRPFPVERMDDARMVGLIGDELRRLADADQFSGVVLVGRGDEILFHGAYGFEHPQTRQPVTTRTRFHLASQGKMFTSVAVAQLIEQGRLSFDATVGQLLPGQPWTEQARGITVRQLLSHTGGLGGLFDRPNYVEGFPFRSAAERLPIFASEPLLFAPGERWSYSNEGFETLAAIVESLSGERINDHLRSRVLLPAGMTSTLPDAPADSLADRALPSPHADDDWFGVRPRITRSRGWNAGGAGGGHATAEDMFRFGRALLAGRLVSRQMVDTLTAPRNVWATDRPAYAYGFETRQVNGRTVVGHGGGGPLGVAICNDLDVFTDGTYTVVVMSNYDAPLCTEIKSAITAMLAAN